MNSVADRPQTRAVEAMVVASRIMTAIVTRTLHDVVKQITVPQLRVLVLLQSRSDEQGRDR